MKKLVKWVARFFGRESRKIVPPPPPGVMKFVNSPEVDLEFDFGADAGQSALTPSAELNAPHLKDRGQATKSLIVEGWRFLPHSYAIVNQWQLLALSRRPDVAIKVIDMPFFRPQWRLQEGLFEEQAEQALRSIESAKPGESADVTLRIFVPFDFSPSRSRQTVVFGTSEYQVLRKIQFPDSRAYEQLNRMPPPENVKAITPSRWSAEGFYKAGFKTEQVLIVPHGVDIGTFHPMPDLRSRIRSKIGVADSDFVFLNVGAMTGNKGIDLLLQAFAEVSQKFPHARLVLKGMDPLYNSKNQLFKSMEKVSSLDLQRIGDRISYFGKPLPNRKLALLYQVADAYVSPYRAEGFNVPVLEAAASGIPIICTRGGATDDFVTDAFARRIESAKLRVRVEDEELTQLKPNVRHLIALMTSAIEDDQWRKQAAEAGPAHVCANYTWDSVVDMLVRKLLN